MSRVWLSLVLFAGFGVLSATEPTSGLLPLPWPVPNDQGVMPRSNLPQRMVPLQPMAPPAPLTPPPLLYLRLVGPAGSCVTFFRGGNVPEKLDLPAVVGFRPGYQYRCALSGMPGRPGIVYIPTFEVRGSMALTAKLRAADFPASVVFNVDELDKLSQGTLVQKIVVLERPETAQPEQSGPNSPVEIAMLAGQDPWPEARERGLPLALVFLGPRAFEPNEMAAPRGTIYLPGDKTLPPPAAMPTVPWTCYPLVDPNLGPMHPADFISVYDGGDSGIPAGFNGQGKLKGVDPSDTVAEYVNSQGVKKLAISNRVALCIPRFIFIRSEVTPFTRGTFAVPEAAVAQKTVAIIEGHREMIERVQKMQLELARTTAKPSSTDSVYGTSVAGAIKSTKITVSIQAPTTLTGAKAPERSLEDGPLLICKWPDRLGANIGDIITFTLKYTNTSKQPIQNVVVIDNLTPRFQYIPGTAKTDRDGAFTFQPNAPGSHLLRWEFSGDLPPGESGLITFEVRVR